MRNFCTLLLLIAVAVFSTACGTDDIPPGHKGFMFDRTGALAMYAGGSGLQDDVLGPGTHWTGIYDEIKGVDCQDAHYKDAIPVLTQSDMKVSVDIRITYAANCADKAALQQIINQVGITEGDFVEPQQLFGKYIMPVVRESLRNHLAESTLEEVKSVRGELALAVMEDLQKAVKEKGFPVTIDLLTVSNIDLPKAIVQKIKEIETARMEANKEMEKQKAAKVRLERELFEAEQERKVEKERALKEKEVATIKAEAEFEMKKQEAQGIREIRQQLTGSYLEYLTLLKGAEVQTKMAAALEKGTKWYVGPDFLVPPDSRSTVAITK